MKRIFIITLCSLAISSNAQPWTKNLHTTPVKIQDIVNEMESIIPKDDEKYTNQNTNIKEGKNYHYSRWKWYWQHHTNVDGYIVSPVKKMQEWYKLSAKRTESQYKTTTDKSSWTFQGPDKSAGGYSGVGRINVVAFHPTDTNIFWIGSAGGGVWKTNNGGSTWVSLGDNFPVMGVSDIAFNPLNPNTVYLATGDKEANDTYSVGLLKSINGGNTWDTTGLQWPVNTFRQIAGVLINPKDTNSLTVATTAGIYKSNDGGGVWAQSSSGYFKQIIYHPTDTNILFATGYTSGTHQIFRSSNGGYTWTQQSNFPANTRVAIAVTKADVKIVKAIVSNASYGLESIYNSTDTGKNYTAIYTPTGSSCTGNILASAPSGNNCGGQGWYDLTIAISPTDAQKVVVGGVNTWYSNNGGTSWQIANQWQSTLPGIKVVHADKHYHAYHPLNPNVLFECNDGGIYKSTNPVSSLWTDLTNGLGITQFYRNAVSNIANFAIGGAQDNGTKKLSGTTYSDLTGGDGMNCVLDPVDNKVYYTALQYGEIRRTTNDGANFTDISNNIPGSPKGDWITPFILHPLNNYFIIAGYTKIYLSQDRGNAWAEISPSFGDNAKRITMSPNKDQHIYVLVNNGIRYTTDLGKNWQIILNKPDGTISDLIADPKNGEKIYVTYSGYGTNKVAEYTLGGSWNLLNQNLPDIPVYCIDVDSSDGTLYIGTDFGVYYRTIAMAQWEPYKNGLPNVEVTDLGINYTSNEIWAATYGRGMWKSVRSGYPIGISSVIPYANNKITVSPNPNNGNFILRANTGSLQNNAATIRILNMDGRIVWQRNIQVPKDGEVDVNTDLPNGTYMVEVLKNNIVFAKTKMIIYK